MLQRKASLALDSCKAELWENNAGSVWSSLETAGVQGLGPPQGERGRGPGDVGHFKVQRFMT